MPFLKDPIIDSGLDPDPYEHQDVHSTMSPFAGSGAGTLMRVVIPGND
jgi:hypothetical protein